MTETLTQALDRVEQDPKQRDVLDLVATMKPEIAKLVPAERFTRILLTELRRTPMLRECDPYSFLGAVMHCAQLGLEPGPLGLAYLIPYKREVTLIVGYRGYVELAYRSGQVRDVVAELVHDGDTFKVQKGTSAKITHETLGPADDREIVAAYAVARLRTGGTVFVATYDEDWESARKASTLGAKSQGPWVDHRAAMIRKTALRRLSPWLPVTAAFSQAYMLDEQPAQPIDTQIAETDAGAL